MSMRQCMLNNELNLSILRAVDDKTVMVQFINKQGKIGVKFFVNNGTRRYL